MADSKITALTAISTVDPAADPLVIVDVSDTSMAASGTTKKATINQLLGASGTATLASATITGDLTVDTNTLKVTASTDTVTVGATTTDAKFRVVDASYNGLRIGFLPGTANYNLYDATVHEFRTASVTPQQLYTLQASSSVWYDGAGGTRMTLNSTGLNIANGNVILGTSGKGIDFSAVTGGTGTATGNVLNDYEEGTWTIDLRFGGASVGITTNATIGRYTKIGRTVTVTGLLSLTSKGSSTGIAEIYGLPFTIASAAEAYSAANVRFNGVSFADVPISIGATGSTKIILQEITNAGVVTDLTNADFTNTSQCIISFTYTV